MFVVNRYYVFKKSEAKRIVNRLVNRLVGWLVCVQESFNPKSVVVVGNDRPPQLVGRPSAANLTEDDDSSKSSSIKSRAS